MTSLDKKNEWFDTCHRERVSLPWLRDNTVFLAISGSQAYGTSRPESDKDYRGVAIAPMEYQIGFQHKFEQADSGFEGDACVYEIIKFMKLAVECNPNVIELLFMDPADIIYAAPAFQTILDQRQMFLSRQARWRFGRYAAAQLRRIETHRRWLQNPPTKEPFRRDFGLPDNTLLPKDQLQAAEKLIQDQLQSWDIDMAGLDPATRMALEDRISKVLAEKITLDKYDLAGRGCGLSDNMIEVMKQERRYTTARKEWDQYQDWKKNRNEIRHELEIKFGYDTKHGMHLVRLLRMAHEILTAGQVIVKRPDAKELLGIRNGEWSYEKLVSYANELDNALDSVMEGSTLPASPDRERIDKLTRSVVTDFLGLTISKE
jgi:predicted nucleotidyltransferase